MASQRVHDRSGDLLKKGLPVHSPGELRSSGVHAFGGADDSAPLRNPLRKVAQGTTVPEIFRLDSKDVPGTFEPDTIDLSPPPDHALPRLFKGNRIGPPAVLRGKPQGQSRRDKCSWAAMQVNESSSRKYSANRRNKVCSERGSLHIERLSDVRSHRPQQVVADRPLGSGAVCSEQSRLGLMDGSYTFELIKSVGQPARTASSCSDRPDRCHLIVREVVVR